MFYDPSRILPNLILQMKQLACELLPFHINAVVESGRGLVVHAHGAVGSWGVFGYVAIILHHRSKIINRRWPGIHGLGDDRFMDISIQIISIIMILPILLKYGISIIHIFGQQIHHFIMFYVRFFFHFILYIFKKNLPAFINFGNLIVVQC